MEVRSVSDFRGGDPWEQNFVEWVLMNMAAGVGGMEILGVVQMT